MTGRKHMSHRLTNLLESAIIMAVLLGLLLLIAWFFAGARGVLFVCFACIPSLIIGAARVGRLVLRMYGAKPLTPELAPDLTRLVEALSRKAELSQVPELYYIPSNAPLAFSVGLGSRGAIALSYGLLRLMSWREITGIIAHELSHIAGRDIWVMSAADVAGRMVSAISFAGQLLLVINLPLYIIGEAQLPWIPIFAMMLAPTLMTLLQLALSRSREYEADRSAAELTGDPAGLAYALDRMEKFQRRQLSRLFIPYGSVEVPSVLRTHPGTTERVERLMELARDMYSHDDAAGMEEPEQRALLHGGLAEPKGRPRRRITGVWY